MKTVKVDWKEFMGGTYKRPTNLQVVVEHIDRNKVVYKLAGSVVVLFLITDVSAFASSIDDKASMFYHNKLLGFGKWALIIKGGWSTIQKTISEDFDGAKKSFFQYLLVYLFLLAFPWAMKEMDGVFA